MLDPHPLSYRYRVVGELFKDVIIAGIVGFRQVAPSNIAAKTEGVKLTLDGADAMMNLRNEGLPVN